ncbi:MmgE/PrpD family protein [Herbaspirillum sp. RV1423]|uniref:MmgE/PrpD family protein n=1 Tax=Herbaspirillum sp. RV1423 TaxID=1443993 RepID=UPI0004B47CEA|nr:MmgE/PrpD family protein [Herbaspirillum sp. RV1423]
MTIPTAIDRLADWVSTLKHDHIPASVRTIAANCLLDTIGVAIAGSATEVARTARAVATDAGSQGHAAAFGSTRLFSAPAAAFVNGVAAHALDFDDNCYAGFVHGSAVIAPAALAVAQQTDASGSDLLTAFIAGSECEYAIGAATNSILYDLGWWTTGVLGPIGACAATAWLLKLDRAQTVSALGLAVAGAGGMKACFGTDGKALMAGRTAEAGVIAALLAAQGASGPRNAFEHWNGFNGLFNQGEFDVAALDRLGARWFMESPGVDIKRIPVCLSSHAAVDAAMALVAQHRIDVAEIEEIICDVPPVVQANLIYDRPSTRQEAQFSLQFAVAVALLYGSVGLEHLDSAILHQPQLVDLMRRVKMTVGPRWNREGACEAAPEGASVSIKARGRDWCEGFQAYARGAAQCPMEQEELEHKFVKCVGIGADAETAALLLPRLKSLDALASVRALFAGGSIIETAKA